MFKNPKVYENDLIGSIHGWDRLRFSGTILWLAHTKGLATFLGRKGILMKEFGGFAQELTQKLRGWCENRAQALKVPFMYLNSSASRKDELARQVAEQNGVDTGDICFFSVVEPCFAPTVVGNAKSKQLEVQMRLRKCLWIYHYWNDPKVGFGHTRIQTWLPFTTTICLNGRHWLERQLIEHGIAFSKDHNCLPWIADLARAQELANSQLQTNWEELLGRLQRQACPDLPQLLGQTDLRYYWCAQETEWATDLMFKDASRLENLCPGILRHCVVSSGSREVLRFLGRSERSVNRFNEVVTDHGERYEGVRIKHSVNGNSVKMYNKAASILRVETTINNPREYKVLRPAQDDPQREPSWQQMRKGVGDLHRRAEVSAGCNRRYVEHLESAQQTGPLGAQAQPVCRPVKLKQRRYRALNPWRHPDYPLLELIARGEYLINGFRNRDLRGVLYPSQETSDAKQGRRDSAKVSRLLALLRAHGLIQKVPKTHRYMITPKGRELASAILAASKADYQKLTELAA
jgi:hypothetical protein